MRQFIHIWKWNIAVTAICMALLHLPLYAQETAVAAQDTAVIPPALQLDSTQTLSEKLKQLFTELDADKTNAALQYEIAKEYLALGRKKFALKYMEESLKNDPTNMDVMYAKGDLLLSLDKKKSGYEAFLTVLRDFQGQAFLERIASRFSSPYKITQLTNNKFNDIMPAFSPDGSTVVFQSDRNGNWDIYSMNIAQGETSIKRLTDDAESDENASFSPDGRFIVFTSTRDDRSTKKYKPREIYYMDRNGKSVKRVTSSYGSDNWSPSFIDTVTIMFASDRSDFSSNPFWTKSSSIFTIEKTGTFLFKVYGDETSALTDPSAKPGIENHILYAEKKSDNNYEIFMGSLDGKDKPTNLTYSKGNDLQPSVSRNDLFIAFASNRDGGNYEIYKMQTDGKDQTRITYDDGDDIFPRFSLDGNKIIFSSNRNGNFQIFMASTEEQSQTTVNTVIPILEKKIASSSDN
ncbi:PD40 domain-containing protein [bacterium]|nr:PD40 domain-containing protein [bacterium]